MNKTDVFTAFIYNSCKHIYQKLIQKCCVIVLIFNFIHNKLIAIIMITIE